MAAAKVTVGCDPEAFLYNLAMDKIVPVCDIVGGTKERPFHFNKKLQKGFTVQEDNVLVEFNIPPAKQLDQWGEYIATATDGVNAYLGTKGPYVMMFRSEHLFEGKDLLSDKAMHFGCSPDYDAYQNGAEFPRVSPKALEVGDGGYRYAGAHVHIGYISEVPHFVAAAFADLVIGLGAVGHDTQGRRRDEYGKPGRYRPKPYGIEYRTPSNYWLRDHYLTFRMGQDAFRLGVYLSTASVDRIRLAYQKIPWSAVREAITRQDMGLAQMVQTYLNDEKLVDSEEMDI